MSPRISDFEYSFTSLNCAGEALRNGDYSDQDLEALTQWRKVNASELSNIRSTVNAALKRASIDKSELIVSQRLKRLPTIINKLKRFPKMKLSRMQDISGIRIVCKDMAVLSAVAKSLDGIFEKRNDYLNEPIESGYRSIHFTKLLRSKVRVELQLRTELQHAWATAVEISDVIHATEGELKTDKNLSGDRTRFFKLVGALMSYEEYTPRYLDLSKQKILAEIGELEMHNHFSNEVSAYSPALKYIGTTRRNKSLIVVAITSTGSKGYIWSFLETEKDKAVKLLSTLENGGDQKYKDYTNVVILRAGDIMKLHRSFPNYFGDSKLFTSFLTNQLPLP